MGLILSQRGPMGFGLPFINKFMIGLWVRGWKGFGFGIWPPKGTSLRLERALGLNIGQLEGWVCVWA